jgi:hypothetical protein
MGFVSTVRGATRWRAALPTLGALAALLMTACGGGESGGAEPSSTSTPGSPVSAAPPPPAPALPAPAPVTPAPVTPAPVTPAPVTPAPVTPAPAGPPPAAPLPASPPRAATAAAVDAATATANSSSNACQAIRPFYWEVGDAGGPLVSGSVNSPGDPAVYAASTRMSVASASKWFYSSYVVQRSGGALSAGDVKFLNFRSGYASRGFGCEPSQTVQECVDSGSNGAYSAEVDGVFAYSGAHMEKHAALGGLGGMNAAMLAAEVRSRLGEEIDLAYSSPQPAGGVVTTANDYATLLRKILRGDLKMRDALGTHAVCTNPRTCADAANAPSPPGESWHYSVGHWVEDDPEVGDGAFSSPGAFGFYPWIDRTKTSYGVVARTAANGAIASVYCGRLIRKAWATATPQ